MNQTMKRPSSWLATGIQMNPADKNRLFHFTHELQSRLEHLLEKRKMEGLVSDEEAELAGLLELDRIFSFINAKFASQPWPFANSPNGSASIFRY